MQVWGRGGLSPDRKSQWEAVLTPKAREEARAAT